MLGYSIFSHFSRCCWFSFIVQGEICSRLVSAPKCCRTGPCWVDRVSLPIWTLGTQSFHLGLVDACEAGSESRLKLVSKRRSHLCNFSSLFIKVAPSENEVFTGSFLFIPVSFLAQLLTFLERTRNVGENPHGRKSTNAHSFIFGVALLMLNFTWTESPNIVNPQRPSQQGSEQNHSCPPAVRDSTSSPL